MKSFKDILVRAGKTFIQGFIASITVALSNGIDITNGKLLLSVFVGAIASGISLAMNLVLNLFEKEKEVK